MKELRGLTRAAVALAVSATTLTIGSVLMRAGWLVLVCGIATKGLGRDIVEVLQR